MEIVLFFIHSILGLLSAYFQSKPACEVLFVKPESLHLYFFWETSHSLFIELAVNTTFTKNNLNVVGIPSKKETKEKLTASNKHT